MDKLYIKRKQKSRDESKFLSIFPDGRGRETVPFVMPLRIRLFRPFFRQDMIPFCQSKKIGTDVFHASNKKNSAATLTAFLSPGASAEPFFHDIRRLSFNTVPV